MLCVSFCMILWVVLIEMCFCREFWFARHCAVAVSPWRRWTIDGRSAGGGRGNILSTVEGYMSLLHGLLYCIGAGHMSLSIVLMKATYLLHSLLYCIGVGYVCLTHCLLYCIDVGYMSLLHCWLCFIDVGYMCLLYYLLYCIDVGSLTTPPKHHSVLRTGNWTERRQLYHLWICTATCPW